MANLVRCRILSDPREIERRQSIQSPGGLTLLRRNLGAARVLRYTRGAEVRHAVIVIALALSLAACDATVPVQESANGERRSSIELYLQTVDGMSEADQAAMREGRPFVGMTYEEAELAMRLIEVQIRIDGNVLQSRFQGPEGQGYTVFFDCADPNRVKDWTVFTDSEVEALSDFRDVHPCPPIPTLTW